MHFSTRIEKYLVLIISEYKRNKKIKKLSHNVFRGRSSSISGFVENEFALLIETLLGCEYQIFIDFPITIDNANSKNETFYPDILIVKNNQIVGIIELKIDIGYSRLSLIEDQDNIIKLLKEKKEVKINRGKNTLKVSNDIKSKIVIITAKNDHGKLHNMNKDNIIILMNDGFHPNDDKIINAKEYIKQIKKEDANISAWNDLEDFIKELIKTT